MENIINKRVKILCPMYNKGNVCYGIIKSIKEQTNNYTTVMVLRDNNKKCTSIALSWLTII